MFKPSRAPLALLFLVAALGLAYYLLRPAHRSASGGDAAEQTTGLVQKDGAIIVGDASPYRDRIKISSVEEVAVSRRRDLPAIVESDPARTVNVLPPVSGRIGGLFVKLGDQVMTGQTLATIESGDLAQARSDVEKARATVQMTKKAVDRTRDLAKIGGGAVKDFEQSTNDNAQANAELARSEQRLSALQGRGEATAGQGLAVKAPFNATVSSLSIAGGAFVNDTAAPIMTLTNQDRVFVTAMVPEKALAFVSSGAEVEIRAAAFPEMVLKGKLATVAQAIEPDTHRAKARIDVNNADGRLRAGMFATVTIVAPERRTPVVPTSALFMNNDETSVFIETKPWTFVRRMVEVGPDDNGVAPVLKGVAAGEHVVVRGGILLND